MHNSITSLNNAKKFFEALHSIIHKANDFTTPYKVVWQHNNSRLLQFSGTNSSNQNILFIPPFINKGYILDIMPNHSIIEFLSKTGLNCFLLDWDEPNSSETEWGLKEYYENKLIPALKFIESQNTVLAGYCLGSILALMAAAENKNTIKGVALIAPPWDFSLYHKPALDSQPFIDFLLEQHEYIPSMWTRNFFLSFMQTGKLAQKMEWIASLDEGEEKELWMKVEKWSLDSILLSRGIFKNFQDLILSNPFLKGDFSIIKSSTSLSDIANIPCFIATGSKDQVAPPLYAKALFDIFTNKHIAETSSGHLGTIIGSNAQKDVWQPMYRWIQSLL